MRAMRQGQAGFTLLEMMIVLAIIGIITAVATPSYQRHVRSTQRAEAVAFMEDCATKMQRHFTQNMTWAGVSLSTVCPTPPASSSKLSANYTISLPTATASAYTLSAAPQGSQASDECGTLSVTSAGGRSATGAGKCW